MLSTCLNPKFSDVFVLSMLEYWHTHTKHTHTHTHTPAVYTRSTAGRRQQHGTQLLVFFFILFFLAWPCTSSQSATRTISLNTHAHTHTHTHAIAYFPPPCFFSCFLLLFSPSLLYWQHNSQATMTPAIYLPTYKCGGTPRGRTTWYLNPKP